MRQLTTLLTGLLLLGGAGLGCDPPAAPGPDPDIASDNALEEVKLTPAHEAVQLREGEFFEYHATAGDGRPVVYRYQVRDGALVPVNNGPELSVIEAHNLGVIPVRTGDQQGQPLRHSAWSGVGGGESAPPPSDWDVQRSAVELAPLEVDTSFRVKTRTYVDRLEQDGREVATRDQADTGPSRAAALTELTLDDGSKAEVYQFDDPQTMELWYRFLHQFHDSLGWETDAQIEVQGMTLLRTDPEFATDARGAFADCSRTTLSH